MALKSQDKAFVAANAALNARQYDEAIHAYESILESGVASAELYYNLGNAYYRQKTLGRAILSYERAIKIRPNYEDAHHNLAFAKASVRSEVTPIPDFFLLSWWKTFYNGLRPNGWAWLSIFTLAFAALAASFWLLYPLSKWRRWAAVFGLVATAVAVVCIFAGYSRSQAISNSRQAVILENDIMLKQGPDLRSPDVRDLSEGVKVFVIDEIGDWRKVYLEDREQGWVLKDWMDTI